MPMFEATAWSRRALAPQATARGRAVSNAVASAVLSGEPGSKAEQKSLAAADVSKRLLIRRAKELIA